MMLVNEAWKLDKGLGCMFRYYQHLHMLSKRLLCLAST